MTTQPFLTTLSKNDEGGYDYLAVSTTFVTEVVKLGISLSLYAALPAASRELPEGEVGRVSSSNDWKIVPSVRP